MRIDYVIVAYRSERHLAGCLDAIAADRPAGAGIIVVDNASPDDAARVATDHSTHPTVLAQTANEGFGAGCNAGAAMSTADAIFFVNPDARIRPGASSLLAECLARQPSAAVAGPRVLDPRGEVTAAAGGAEPSLRSALGHFFWLSRFPVVGRSFPPLHLRHADRPAEPDWITGAAMMVRRAAFEVVGGFDERFFLYMEDVDLCRRLRAAGWRVLYEPDAQVEHDIGGSQSDGQPARWFRAFDGYVRAHRGRMEARLVAVVATVGFLGRAILQSRARARNARRMLAAAREAARAVLFPRGPGDQPR